MALSLLAWISLEIAFASAFIILIDEMRHSQRMAVMNVVWPISALYFSVFAVWAYFWIGRKAATDAPTMKMKGSGGGDGPPTPTQVAVGTSHCGAGCTIADVFTEFGIAGAGFTLFGSVLWTEYLLDFLVAWVVGIAFSTLRSSRSVTSCRGPAQSGPPSRLTLFRLRLSR